MNLPTIYGLCALAVCGVSWLSRVTTLQKVSLILFGSWAVYNFTQGTVQPPKLLVFNSLIDICCMTMVACVLIRNSHQKLLYALMLLYVVELLFHFAWLWYKIPVFAPYFTALNVLFALQLAAVGATGVFAFWNRCVSSVHSLRSGNSGLPIGRKS